MARPTREQQPGGAGVDRAAAKDDRRHGLRLVLTIVAVLVVAAVALGAVLLNRGGGDVQTDAPEPAPGGQEEAAYQADGDADATVSGDAQAAAVEPCPPTDDDLPLPTTTPYAEPPSADLAGAEVLRATLVTTCGTVVVDLDAGEAPATVANFVALAQDGYYAGVGFHRVIDGFMVQGGDPTGTGEGCLDDACSARLPGYGFADELGLAEEIVAETGGYPRGTVAMANAGPDTNGSQFFIVQASPGYPLPPSYTVFGQVVEGMDIVDRIALGPVDGDLAVDPVVILSIDVER